VGPVKCRSSVHTDSQQLLMSLSEMIAVLDNTESSAELLLLLDAIAEVC
jgi:hypothetical protein